MTPDYYLFVSFFSLGLLVVIGYARQRFNEPSFPGQETLPRTVEPLQYLFLKPAYGKARFTYVVALLLLYALLVIPGPSMLKALGGDDSNFSPQAWPLLVALILTGVGAAPSAVKWLNIVEELLRRWVHAWFLVPDGVRSTIAVLDDAHYDPPASQLNFVAGPRRERSQEDLKLATSSLRYRWARATILVTSLKHIGDSAHPLKKEAFQPFEEDFKAILATYRALKPDVEAPAGEPTGSDNEENLSASVDNLLRRIYGYISWGVRRQANSERQVDRTLEELGFRVPKTSDRRLLDILVPTILLVALITTGFWILTDALNRELGVAAPGMTKSVVFALSSGMASGLMYGSAVAIALGRRSAKIEQRVWREPSWRCLIPIAAMAGLVTWGVIILSTVYWKPAETWRSLIGLWELLRPPSAAGAQGLAGAEWSFLPIKIITALPWFLVGAMASVLLAMRVGGNVYRLDMSHRLRDAGVMALALGLTAAAAQGLQTCLVDVLHDLGVSPEQAPAFSLVAIDGLAEFACGAVIGFMVPQAYRASFVTPSDPVMARAIQELLRQARLELGSKAAAEDWVFMPNSDLDGITPAEAVQYKSHATGVGRLEAQRRREETRSERLAPVVIEGGRGTDQPATSFA
jgi:hypothetical protein